MPAPRVLRTATLALLLATGLVEVHDTVRAAPQRGNTPTARQLGQLALPSTRPADPDDDPFLSDLSQLVARGPLQQFAARTIQLSPDAVTRLDQVVQTTFADHLQFRTLLQRQGVPSGALFAQPVIGDEVLEFPDAMVLRVHTAVVVSDPAAFARISPQFADFMSGASSAGAPATIDDLPAEGRAGLEAFMAMELPALPPTHPLRQAADQGANATERANAVLRAITAGFGDFSLTRTIRIPKVNYSPASFEVRPSVGPVRLVAGRASGASAPIIPRPETAVASVVEALRRETIEDVPRLAALRAVERVAPRIGRGAVSYRNGRYVEASPNVNDRGTLHARSRGVSENGYNTFAVLGRGADFVSLQSARSGRFVEELDGGRLAATAESLDEAARFHLVAAGEPKLAAPLGRLAATPPTGYTLRADGRFVVALADGSLTLSQKGPATIFRFEASEFRPWMSGSVLREDGAGLGDVNLEFRHTDGSGTPGRRRTRGNGGFERYYAAHGTLFTVTPNKPGFFFLPDSADVLLDGVENRLNFTAVQRTTTTGTVDFTARFVTGFDERKTWEDSERWGYTGGYFRISYGARYRAGLRIPIEVTGHMEPAHIVYIANRDEDLQPITGTIEVHPSDRRASWYRSAGLPDDEVDDGDELTLGGSVMFGLKLRVFWTTVLNRSDRWYDLVDIGRDFTPPFSGNPDGHLDLELDPDDTHSKFGIDNRVVSLNAYAQFMFRFSGGDSEVGLRVVPWFDGRGRTARTLTFDDQEPHDLPGFNTGQMRRFGTASYGYRLSDATYRSTVTVTPGIRFGGEAGAFGYSRHLNTDWIMIDAAQIDLGGLTLRQHSRTGPTLFEAGRRQFRPEPKQ